MSWIRIAALVLVAAVVALLPNTADAEYCLSPPCQPLTGQALFTDACAMLLGARLSGYPDPQESEWLANCAKAGKLCRDTKNYIEKESHRSVPDLVCQAGDGEAVHDKQRSLRVDEVGKIPAGEMSFYNDACAMLVGSRLSGYRNPKEQEYIAGCGKHPDPSLCRTTKKYIEDTSHRPMPELVCGK